MVMKRVLVCRLGAIIASTILLAAATAECFAAEQQVSAVSIWPAWRGGMRCEGRSRFRGPHSVKEDWRLKLGDGDFVTAPVIDAQGRLFVVFQHSPWSQYTADSEDTLIVVEPRRRAKYAVGTGAVFGSPVIDMCGRLLLGTYENGLMLFDFFPDGHLLLKRVHRTEGFIVSPLLLTGQWVWAIEANQSECDRRCICFDVKDFRQRLSSEAPEQYTGRMASDGIRTYAVQEHAKLKAFDNEDLGVYPWQISPDESALEIGQPAIGLDGTIHFAALHEDATGRVFAVSPDGKVKWSNNIEGTPRSPAITRTGDVIYATSGGNGGLYSFSVAGNLKWKIKLPLSELGEPIVDRDGYVYVSSLTGDVFCVSPLGEEMWRYSMPCERQRCSLSPVLFDDSGLYFVSNGTLYTLSEPEPEYTGGPSVPVTPETDSRAR